MLTTLIFSKNRACQLDLLLRSIQQNLSICDDIIVLYKATESQFEKAYIKLLYKFPKHIFLEEETFSEDVNFILKRACKDYILFFVDDNIVYKDCNYLKQHIVRDLLYNPDDVCCLSLRLGFNIEYQDPNTKASIQYPILLGKFAIEDNEFICWDYRSCNRYGNFGYAFSVDGHIYKRDTILQGLNYEYQTPNDFEGRYNISHFGRYMACYRESVVVNTPVNAVANYNTAGNTFPADIYQLNEKFLDNYVIDLNSITQTNVVSCHQEIPFSFIKEQQ